MKKPLIVGVSGGSGSGKSYFCKAFAARCQANEIVLLCSDHYFKSELPKMTSPLTNREYDDWNSPESIDYPRLLEDVKRAAMQDVKVVLVEGAYIFAYEELRKMMQLKIFIDTDIELRLYRRIKRNMEHFQMEMDDIASYFIESAKFQEQVYSAPTKIYADLIFNGAKDFDIPFEVLDAYIKSRQKED